MQYLLNLFIQYIIFFGIRPVLFLKLELEVKNQARCLLHGLVFGWEGRERCAANDRKGRNK